MSTLQSKVPTRAAGGTQIKLLFTVSNFLKHFVDLWEKRYEMAVLYIRKRVRGPVFWITVQHTEMLYISLFGNVCFVGIEV